MHTGVSGVSALSHKKRTDVGSECERTDSVSAINTDLGTSMCLHHPFLPAKSHTANFYHKSDDQCLNVVQSFT